MIRCAALGCGNDDESGVSLFPLPKKQELKRKWEANIGRNDLGPSSAVCEVHFADCDLAIKDGVKFMKAAAVPNMFGRHSNRGEGESPIRRSDRKKQAPYKRANLRKIPCKPVAKDSVKKEKLMSSLAKCPNKPDDEPVYDHRDGEQQNDEPPQRAYNKPRKTTRMESPPSEESEDVPRKLSLKLDGADERGHAIAEWYLLDIFEATRLISSSLQTGTLITDSLVANVEETIIEVISKLLQRVSSVIITSIEKEFNVRSDIRKILGQLDGDVVVGVQLLLEENRGETNQPELANVKTEDGYEKALLQLDPSCGDRNGNVIEEVISPATEDCQVLLEHSYFKEAAMELIKGENMKDKKEKAKRELHCGFCEFKTFWKPKLRRHLHFKHLRGERNYSCPSCFYVAPSEEGLQKHFRTHTGAKPFACSVCNFCTANKSNLTRHMLIHTGEKPFQCSYCDKTFRQKVSLASHIKSHIRRIKEENDKGNNIYACGACGFVTIERSEWVAHSKVHKEYRCAHCDFVCSEYADLKEHQVQHRGLSHVCRTCSHKCHNADELRIHKETHKAGLDIVCNLCGYRTTKQSYLNRHIASHSGEKPFKCQYCFSKFRTKGQLNCHIRRHEIGPFCKR